MIKKTVLMLLVSSLGLPTITAKEVLPIPKTIISSPLETTDISGKWELFIDETLDGQVEESIQTVFSSCVFNITLDEAGSAFTGVFSNCESGEYLISGAIYDNIFNAIQYSQDENQRDYLTYSGIIENNNLIRGTYHTAAGSGDFEWRRKDVRLSEKVKKFSQPSARINSANTTNTHIVEEGDTLFSLSRKYGISLDNLMEWNGKTTEDTVIKIGEKLIVGGE